MKKHQFFHHMKSCFCKFGMVILFFLSVQPAFAADLTITCGSSSCTKDTNTALFTASEIWYPGHMASRTIHFINTTNDNRTLTTQALNSTQTGNVDTVMNFLLTQTGNPTPFFDNTLYTFYKSSAIALPTLLSNNTLDFAIAITMDKEAGNEFQEKSTTFDLQFNISGIPDPVVISDNGGGGGGTSTGGTGGGGTTTPTTSNILGAFTGGLQTFFTGITNPEVEGVMTETPPAEEIQLPGEKLGASTTLCKTCVWWQILLGEICALIIAYVLAKKRHKPYGFMLSGIGILLITLALFFMINQPCEKIWLLFLESPSFWCKYFVIIALSIYALLSFLMRRKNT